MEDRRMLAVFTVTDIDDPTDVTPNGDTEGSLRQMIVNAQANFGPDTIEFDPVFFNPNDCIHRTIPWHEELFINSDLEIIGPGAAEVTLLANSGTTAAGDGVRHFSITSAVDAPYAAKFSGLTFSGADPADTFENSGGSIRAHGPLELRSIVFDGNSALSDFNSERAGGAVYALSSLVVEASVFRNNRASVGGALAIQGSEKAVTVTDTLFESNSALDRGGAMSVQGVVHADIIGSRFVGNKVEDGVSSAPRGGGALYVATTFFGNSNNPPPDGVDLIDSLVYGNTSDADGGGIYIESRLRVSRSTIEENTADMSGGGIFALGYLKLDESEVSSNTAVGGDGGGVFVSSSGYYDVLAFASLFHNNEASSGNGGGWAGAKDHTVIQNSTFSGNTAATAGGGLFFPEVSASYVGLENVTVTANKAASGGGVSAHASADALLRNTIVSGNNLSNGTTASNIAGAVNINSEFNLIGVGGSGGITHDALGTSLGNLVEADNDPELGPLQDNGGPLLYNDEPLLSHLPATTSNAIDNGDPQVLHNLRQYDQRGGIRVLGGRLDIGAVERIVEIPTSELSNSLNLYVDNLGFEEFESVPRIHTGGGASYLDHPPGWEVLSDRTPDYYNSRGYFGGTLDLGVAPEPTTNGDAFIGLWTEDGIKPPEYAVQRLNTPLVAGKEYSISLYAGMADVGSPSGAFVGELVLYGFLDGEAQFPTSVYTSIEGQEDVVQLLSVEVNFGSSEWFAYPTLFFTPTQDIEAIVFGARAGATSPNSYLLIDAGPALGSGDYNDDGLVDAADYSVWRDSIDDIVTPFSGADGNGDGEVNQADYKVWQYTYGAGLIGDFNGDDIVNAADYTIWRDTLGSETDLRADANRDGRIDGNDYVIWRETYGSTLNSVVFNFLTAPQDDVYLVSTFDDIVDGDYSPGNLSLREAILLANASGNPSIIYLEEGRYLLTRNGVEGSDASYNDLDITEMIKIYGVGAGATIIDVSSLTGSQGNAFEVHGGGNLLLGRITLTGGTAYQTQLLYAGMGSTLTIEDSAVVNNDGSGQYGYTLYAEGADVTILRSVFTNNSPFNYYPSAVYVYGEEGAEASLTIGDSIFALNRPSGTVPSYVAQNVVIDNAVTASNLGGNLYDDADGGFFDYNPHVTDYLGTPDYVVTTVRDTFNHADNAESLSIREAIDLANQASGAQVIWLPAWALALTRDRQTYGGGSPTDTDVAFGDLDIKGPLTIRGVAGQTRIEWKPGVVDAVFDLLGDANDDGLSDQDTNSADYTVWSNQNGSGSGTSVDWEVFTADFDDDGDVDAADHAIWSSYYGNSLDLFDVDVV